MENNLLEDIEAKLAADSEGAYKRQLLELLRKYTQDLSYSKHKLLLPEKYDYLEHLDNALNAAILTILKYDPVKSRPPEDTQVDTFNNIFII